MASAIPAVVGLVSSVFGTSRKEKAERKSRRRAGDEQQRLMAEREQDFQRMMQPVFTQQALDSMLGRQKDVLLGGQQEAYGQLNDQLAFRGMGRSGMAEDLTMKLGMSRARNLAQAQLGLQQQQMGMNYQGMLNAYKYKQGTTGPIQNVSQYQTQMLARDPWGDLASQTGKSLSGLGGTMFGQSQKFGQQQQLLGQLQGMQPIQMGIYNLDSRYG